MKKTVIFFWVFVLFMFFFQSCKKENKYSCSQDINDWVTTYKSGFADITREQLASLPIGYQIAVYRSFSSLKKYEIWNEKLNLVKTQEWDELMQNKINELDNVLKPEIFTNDDGSNQKEIVLTILDNWQTSVLGELRMDSLDYFISFYTIMTEDEISMLVNNPEAIDYSWLKGGDEITMEPGPGGGGAHDCVCSWSMGCSIFMNSACDETITCNQVDGCGFFFLYKCKGMCEENLSY
ncbi:MAG TPA: bacteriocin fulvocin C-related protein [Bacteroidales bacterium]